jgi:hypothetical protein
MGVRRCGENGVIQQVFPGSRELPPRDHPNGLLLGEFGKARHVGRGSHSHVG